ncbi:AAA family ATPase, partial [Paenibacillus sepulcri]|nr:AAA family ATPase [Paenibacillus sepulcri]
MADKQQVHIVLVGFMGTGKSTVSQLLARRLDCETIDVDAEIERREGRSIPEIF